MIRRPISLLLGLALLGATPRLAHADQAPVNQWASGVQTAAYTTPVAGTLISPTSPLNGDATIGAIQQASATSPVTCTDAASPLLQPVSCGSVPCNSGSCISPQSCASPLSCTAQTGGCTAQTGGCTAQTGACTAQTGGCNPGCSSTPGGCNACGCGSGRLYPFVGVEATFFAPAHSGGTSSTSSLFNGNATTVTDAASPNGLNVGPRLWLGVVGDRWGVLTRYWRFYDDHSASGAAFGTASILQQSYLHLQTFDVEAIRRLQFGANSNTSTWFTFGARYAEFNQGSSITSINSNPGSLLTTTATSASNFSGTGITSSFWGLRQIGYSKVSLFFSGRASELWDSKGGGAIAQTSALYGSSLGGAGSVNQSLASGGNGTLFIGEVQIGLQFSQALSCIPGTAFFRTGFEYQYWGLNGVGTANSSSFAGANGGPIGTATAAANSGFLDLVGFNIGAGFMW